MDIVIAFTLLFTFTLVWLAAAWLDSRHQWRLVDWMNGSCSNPFSSKSTDSVARSNNIKKDEEITQLKERIAVLEKLVTEPAYELNKKLNRL